MVSDIKKYSAEFLGTCVLVFFGCGAAAFNSAFGLSLGNLGVAMAFGLSIVALAYVIGNISGCHINPAVSLAMAINGKISWKTFLFYVIAQILGAILGCLLLCIVIWCTTGSFEYVAEVGLGANGYGTASAVKISLVGALIVEVILTFVFVFAVLGVTDNPKNSSVSGIVIGLVLALVHIMGIPLTGTSVNPARSIAPALFLGGTAISQVWVFILAPMAGAALAALVFKAFKKPSPVAVEESDDEIEEQPTEEEA